MMVDRFGILPLLLKAFGIREQEFHNLALDFEDFKSWYEGTRKIKAKVYVGFNNIISAMNEEIGNAKSHVWLYRSHGTDVSSRRGIVDTLDQKLNSEDSPLQIIKRIVTLYHENSDDLRRICEHFVRFFFGHNNVHLKAIDKGYLGINLLIVDNRVALFCLPDDSGNSVGYAFRVEHRDLIISLQWLYKRVELASEPIIEPYGKPLKREEVMGRLESLMSQVNNPLPNLGARMGADWGVSRPPSLEEKTCSAELEYLPDYQTYLNEMRKALKATKRSCLLYRSHRSDGKADKPFVDAFIEKCKEVRRKTSDVDVCSFKRIVYYFDNDNLRNELDRCIEYMAHVENAMLGVVEHQIDAVNLAIFDAESAFIGFHDDGGTAVLCGLKITDRNLVAGIVNMYHRLELKMDQPLLTEKDMALRQQQKVRALEYVANGFVD